MISLIFFIISLNCYDYAVHIRVSTDRQTVDNQRFEIERFCLKNDLAVGQWIEEIISGSKSPEKRLLGSLKLMPQ
jgi:DNA invertase Pin-like site-specific DNA recombinase